MTYLRAAPDCASSAGREEGEALDGANWSLIESL